MRLACSYKIIDKWTYIIQVVYKPLTLNRSETVQPCYCVPVPRVILSPNPSGCTESAIHEHLKGENWTICHLLKVGPKKHEWCLKYCLGVWDWFHNCFILEVAHHLQNENLNIYCREELKCAHLNVVLFMPPNTVSLIQPFDQGKMKAFKTPFMKACETLHMKETPWWIPGSQSLYVTQLVMLAQSRAASSRLLWKTVGKCLTRLHEKFQSLWRCYRKKKKNGDKNKHLPHTNKWRRLWGREGRRCGGSCGREASRDPWWRPGQRTRQGIRFSDESQLKIPKCCPSLTAAQITRWNSALGRVVSDVEECGPESEQSLTLKHHCVCTLHQDLMWKRFEVNSQANKAD